MIFSLSNLIRRGFCKISRNENIQDLTHKVSNVTEKTRDIKKTITIAIVGKTNAGKSTLINAIMKMNICAASVKPQTTIRYQRVFNMEGDTQIVMLDTPGIESARNKKKFNITGEADVFTIKTLKNADAVGVVVDASNKYDKMKLPSIVKFFLATLPVKTTIILILNKVDRVEPKSKLLRLIDKLCDDIKSNEPINLSNRTFSRIFLISALHNDGVDALVDYIRSIAQEKKDCKSSGKLSDHADHEIVRERVRAALLEYLPHNMPYECSCEVEYLEENTLGKVNIVVCIKTPTRYIERKVGNPSFLEKISVVCEDDLKEVFGKPVSLKLYVSRPKIKHKKNI